MSALAPEGSDSWNAYPEHYCLHPTGFFQGVSSEGKSLIDIQLLRLFFIVC